MALTFALDDRQLVGNKRQVSGTVTFDSSYPTNGESFTAADLGLTAITNFEAQPSTVGYVAVWDRSTSAPKLMAFYGDNNNASDGPLIEVPNATSLTTSVHRFVATGY